MSTSEPENVARMSLSLGAIFQSSYVAEFRSHYRDIHPPPSHLLRAIVNGVPGRSPRALLDHVARRIPHCSAAEFSHIFMFLSNLTENARWGVEPDSAFIKALCRTQLLFGFLFPIMNILPIPRPSSTHNDSETIITSSMRLMKGVMVRMIDEWLEESGAFLRAVCRPYGLFDALEHILTPEVASSHSLG